jgi:hypothetical protein
VVVGVAVGVTLGVGELWDPVGGDELHCEAGGTGAAE